ncbi:MULTISPECIES: DUF2552 family protein [Bacillaceae]|uniref:DUF2552 family protein n=2 Tax=Metabacillus TaxID=2675233 RepID=A0ABS5LFY2_9BACI|nr:MULTISPECIES: DUF2552 family protein [Bacillaceae]KZZ86170.1 hypothetical protein AS29_000920 [Bacillus sp. SJS]MBS2969516.1 DUF2552 family protein [Metabacillus flavus]
MKKDKFQSMKNIAQDKTWVSFLNNNHPFSLMHWSIGGIHDEQKNVWLLQDEMTFQAQEFPTIDDAITWMRENMEDVTDVL